MAAFILASCVILSVGVKVGVLVTKRLINKIERNQYFAFNQPADTLKAQTDERKRYCLRACIVLYGVPKAFDHIWQSYMKNIIQHNPHVHFEVRMHAYSDLHKQHPFMNAWSGEIGVKLASMSFIKGILKKSGIPVHLHTTLQSSFDDNDLSWLQQTDAIHFSYKYPFTTIKNIFRQANSLKEAFQSQQKQSDDVDVYVFARSDTFLLTPIDIPCSAIGKYNIQVPSWEEWGGFNDRFALSGPAAAQIFATKRFDGYKKLVEDKRKYGNGSKGEILVSEFMLKEFLNKAGVLNITRMEGSWAKMLRIRAGGRIDAWDKGVFGLNVTNVRDFAV